MREHSEYTEKEHFSAHELLKNLEIRVALLEKESQHQQARIENNEKVGNNRFARAVVIVIGALVTAISYFGKAFLDSLR